MIEYFAAWEKTVREALARKIPRADEEHLWNEHRRKLSYLQHERLIHLLVTLAVGLCTLIAVLSTLFLRTTALLALDVLFTVLLVPYLFHYRRLENTAQRWYALADTIEEKLRKSHN